MNLRIVLFACVFASALVEGVFSKNHGANNKNKKSKHQQTSTDKFLGRLNDAINLIQTKSDYSNPEPILVKPRYLDDDKGVRAEAKIIGGVLVSKKYSWMVSLQESRPDGYFNHVCGGTLVAPNWVLTAAHCRTDIINRACIGGIHLDVHELISAMPTIVQALGTEFQCFAVEKFVVHPDFDISTFQNDIQLIKLMGNSTNTPLPLADDPALTAPNTPIGLAGWGIAEGTAGEASPALRFIEMEVAPRETCDVFNPPIVKPLPHTQFCDLGIPNKGSCSGDSGGPAFSVNTEPQVLIGLVSFGSGDCFAGLPSIYTNTMMYKGWVENITQPEVWRHPCYFNPCKNGKCQLCESKNSACIGTPYGMASCSCANGFTGTLCQTSFRDISMSGQPSAASAAGARYQTTIMAVIGALLLM